MSLFDEVYGLKFQSAQQQIEILNLAIQQQMGKGFEDKESLEKWAHEHYLDKILFSSMSHQFMCISHKGEIMLPQVFERYYGNLLFYTEQKGDRIVTRHWHPEGFIYYNKAYITSEQSDGIHRPLYYRDYTLPTGYYNDAKDAFNIAKPFPVFAAETHADTTLIYKYIEHIAGECAFHLLAWLRAKLLYPTIKTQIIPIFISRTQGSGKTTFAEVICKGLFGKENVLVSDQYDSTARFNADYADSLIVCLEEKEEVDNRNTASVLKSRSTATTIRKEKKGIDPIYQESYTDFIMTSNRDVPIKFDSSDDQRRFMIMEVDPNFTRKTSELADEVFTKLYGFDANYKKVGTPFVEDSSLIAQFKHELFSRQDIASINMRDFPRTDAYKRCFSMPRTSEAVEIESILRQLAPFIKAALLNNTLVKELGTERIENVLQYIGAFQFMPKYKDNPAMVVLCIPLIFSDLHTGKPFPHATIERSLYDCRPWLSKELGITILTDMSPIQGGFTSLSGRYRSAPAARFCLEKDRAYVKVNCANTQVANKPIKRLGKRLRVDERFNVSLKGCFETVNELKDGVNTLKNKTANVQYLDTFLLESDEATAVQLTQEQIKGRKWLGKRASSVPIDAEYLYKERLHTARAEADRLFNNGIVARVVYSGAKSYHLLVRVSDAPKNIAEYKWLHAYLCTSLSDCIIFDISTCDPAHLTRSPLSLKRESHNYGLTIIGQQKLIAEDWSHTYKLCWREIYNQWLNRPLSGIEKVKGKRVYPTRPEYMESLKAIIDGSFWFDAKFSGNRQRLFFPSYRLLRVLGYSHDEAWNSIIIPKLSNYVKQNEINYWITRQDSKIILDIDTSIDDYNNEWQTKEV